MTSPCHSGGNLLEVIKIVTTQLIILTQITLLK